MKDPAEVATVSFRCRITPSESNKAHARAKLLSCHQADNAMKGLLGTPLDDLAILRTALRKMNEPPEGAREAFAALTRSFGQADKPWPSKREGEELKRWVEWAATILRGIAIEDKLKGRK